LTTSGGATELVRTRLSCGVPSAAEIEGANTEHEDNSISRLSKILIPRRDDRVSICFLFFKVKHKFFCSANRYYILGLIAGGVITAFLNLGWVADKTTSYKTITRHVTKTITTTITVTHTALSSQPSSCAVFKALKDYYKINEPVTFRLINNCNEDLILPNSAPWIIKDSRGETIFSPISLQVITRIKPGSFKEWSWNQKDNQGRNVGPGTYYIEIKIINQGVFKLSIKIID